MSVKKDFAQKTKLSIKETQIFNLIDKKFMQSLQDFLAETLDIILHF